MEIGTPFTESSTKVLLCGSGELGKEIVIELKRYGVEVIAVDSYDKAPAMQVADHSAVINMSDYDELKRVITEYNPNIIIPEVESIATDVLVEVEKLNKIKVVPSARAANLTMDREAIRLLVDKKLNVKVSKYRFSDSIKSLDESVNEIGLPCVIKPTMSSSGKGQSVIQDRSETIKAWEYAKRGSRGRFKKVIVEEFIDFDYEITVLAVRHVGGILFCDPIGHKQLNGDYIESWQPYEMKKEILNKCLEYCKKITYEIGGEEGYGVYGVEFFVKGEEVIFSELSPRPHDTGMVTMISQNLSQFSLHVRAILGFPVNNIYNISPSASIPLIIEGESENIKYSNLDKVFLEDNTEVRIFGKPNVKGRRRLGVVLARGETVEKALDKAKSSRNLIKVSL